MMLIISTLQSSIDKMVPKTSYLKMVDIFLIYSFNIVIVIMGVHTYMDMCIHRDSVTGIIVNKESRPSSKVFFSIFSIRYWSIHPKTNIKQATHLISISVIAINTK